MPNGRWTGLENNGPDRYLCRFLKLTGKVLKIIISSTTGREDSVIPFFYPYPGAKGTFYAPIQFITNLDLKKIPSGI
jgi:hypothetical protein